MASPGRAEEWLAARAFVVAGGSTRQAAEKFGIPYSTLRKRCTREAWIATRTQIGRAVVAETDESLKTDLVARARAANESADRVAAQIESTVSLLATALHGAVSRAAEDGKGLQGFADALSALASAHARLHKTRRLALEVDRGSGERVGLQDEIDAVLREMELSGEIVGPGIRVEGDEAFERVAPSGVGRHDA